MASKEQEINNLIPSNLLADENDNDNLNYIDEPDCDWNDSFEDESQNNIKKVYNFLDSHLN